MSTLRLVFHDQLDHNIASLAGCDKKADTILMVEARDEFTHVKHHQKKIAFILSAMRHFAAELQVKKYNLLYVKLDDSENTGTLPQEIKKAIQQLKPQKFVTTWPADHRILTYLNELAHEVNCDFEIREDDRFLASRRDFQKWAENRKEFRMEYFYREMRLKHDILMNAGKPIGGKWNYDAENRKFPKKNLEIPNSFSAKPDKTTQDVIKLVAQEFGTHFGDLEPFYFAVTRDQALKALDLFITERLSSFGDYQDAMIEGEPWMYHSHISFYINIGLLNPLECIKKAEEAYYGKKASLNSVEGFIRQILGWREYVRGIYWHFMPKYKDMNFFKADRKLPDFFWTGETNMNCMRQCIMETKENAYAHHIQRLMVLGNFLLLIGANPDEVNEWYLIVYADAYEWVELPNVTGMILFADGGKLASKPYAASGAYIHKMSNYCQNCTYKVDIKNGPEACPFNYLYWDFLDRHHDKLKNNQRLGMIYNTLERMSDDRKAQIRKDAKNFLESLN